MAIGRVRVCHGAGVWDDRSIETIEPSPQTQPRDVRSQTQLRSGALLVAVAGCLLFAVTFLPWTSFPAQYVDGGRGIQSFSGWDLIVACAHRSFPGQCVVEDRSPSPEFIPDRVIAGDWALVAGALFIVIGVMILAMRSRDRWSRALIVSGWVVALAAMACGVDTLVENFFDQPNGLPGPSVGSGVWMASASPVVASLWALR